MHAVALTAVNGLTSSFLCTSRSLPHSVARSNFVAQCRNAGRRSCSFRSGGSFLVAAAGDWSSSKSNPSRAVVSDEIEGIPVGEYGERMLVPNHFEDDDYDDDIGEIRLECDANGCTITMPDARSLADEATGSGYLRCDLTGCYYTPEAPAVKNFEVIEGEGWRLGYETAPSSVDSYCAIVGAGQWSIALTGGEFSDFCTLIQTLRKGILTVDEENFAGRDDIVLQVEKGSVWMECSLPKKRVAVLQQLWKPGGGNFLDTQRKQAFEIRFILSGGPNKRQAEGYWPSEAVMDMLNKIDAANFDPKGGAFFENVPRSKRVPQ
ncbi:hypothetical protein R1flu_014257 [Riccia fluitans]|uniref:Uncharacterized protein n=1 Tax=Riccia fluitans TaxID=41844 RepID=A0ABD1YFY4_9MARC